MRPKDSLLCVATIGSETKLIQVMLIVVLTAVMMTASKPSFEIHDLRMEGLKPAIIGTSLLFCLWKKFLKLVISWKFIGNILGNFIYRLFNDWID